MTDSHADSAAPTLREQLLAAAADWAARTRLSLSSLGTRAVNDGKFFDRIARGGDCSTANFEKAMAYIRRTLPPEKPEAAE